MFIWNTFLNEATNRLWIRPIISLALSHALSPKRLKEIQIIIEEYENEIIEEFIPSLIGQKHFIFLFIRQYL